MEVIGKVESDRFICIVNKTEIEKFLNLYYNKMDKIEVGSCINLGKGYDFYHDAMSAMACTEKFVRENKDVIDAVFTGIQVVCNKSEEIESASAMFDKIKKKKE